MKDPLLDLHLCKGLGDTICATPVLRKLFYAYGKKISVLTDFPHLFKNNKYVNKIFNAENSNRDELEENFELLVSFAPNLENRYKLKFIFSICIYCKIKITMDRSNWYIH